MKRSVLFFLLLVSLNASFFCQSTPEIIWQKTLGGSGIDAARGIITTPDGGYIVVGVTYSDDGDVKGWHEGYDDNNRPCSDAWIIKLDSGGNIVWKKLLEEAMMTMLMI